MAYQAQAVDTTEPISDTVWELTANAGLYNVVSGCDVTLDTGDMTYDVAAGVITHNGDTVSVSAQADAGTLVADGSNPRWAWICLDSTGTEVLVSGDAASDPIVPELGDRVALSLIRVPANETLASNCTDIEKRIPVPGTVHLIGVGALTEVTGTEASATDEVTVSTATTTGASALRIEFSFRKTSGAASEVAFGIKLNSTTIFEADTGDSWVSATNQAEDGYAVIDIGPRAANYVNGLVGFSVARVSATGAAAASQTFRSNALDAVMPTADLTSVTIRAITGNAGVTYGIYNVRVYRVN